MKILILLFLLASCNVIKAISNTSTEVPNDFSSSESSSESTIDYEGYWQSDCVPDGISLDYMIYLSFANGGYEIERT